MARRGTLLIILSSLVLSALVSLAIARRGDRDRVYTVVALRYDLRRDPRAWVGQIVRVPGALPPAFLWHVPLLDRLLPSPQTVRWAAVAVYRVQLRATICNSGIASPCYAAVLLDAGR